jgi:hypothetical protein
VSPRHAITDALVVSRALCVLEQTKVPFEQFFFDWFGGISSEPRATKSPFRAAYETPVFNAFRELFAEYTPAPGARLDDVYFSRETPCTLLIDEIESIWSAIDRSDDWGPFDRKIAEIRSLPPLP